MLNRLVSFALDQPLLVFLLTLLFIGSGVMAFRALPVEAFPDVTDTQVQVITLFPGRAAEEVEKQVTMPIEIGLSGIPHSVRVFSHTMFGLSFVVLTFDDGVDAYFARQQVIERLRGVDLPQGVTPDLGPLATPIGEIYRYRLKGDGVTPPVSPMDLRTLQDWVVEKQLKTVPGVADVVTYGGLVKQYQVQPDAARMKSLNITLQQLYTSLGRGNANAGGSYLEKGEQQYLIRGIGLLRSPDDIGNVVVDARGGTPVLVKDVASVEIGAVPRQGLVGQGNEDDCVNGIILMRKGENPSEVLKAVREKVDNLNARVLPKGVKIDPIYDRTWLIGTTLKTVFKNLAEGAMLVTLVLLLFLGNIRAAIIVAITIPLSLMATFLGLTFKGIPANLLSLGAMDFGIIVDGAVIVVENIFRELSEHSHKRGKRCALFGRPVGSPAVEPDDKIPTSIVGEIAAGAKHPVAALIASGVLQNPHLGVKQQVWARSLHGMDHRFKQGEQVRRDSRLSHLTSLRKHINLLGRAPHCIQNRDRVAALSNPMGRERKRDRQGRSQIEGKRRRHGVSELESAGRPKLFGECGATVRFKHRRAPTRRECRAIPGAAESSGTPAGYSPTIRATLAASVYSPVVPGIAYVPVRGCG